jgi:hypothetical protein
MEHGNKATCPRVGSSLLEEREEWYALWNHIDVWLEDSNCLVLFVCPDSAFIISRVSGVHQSCLGVAIPPNLVGAILASLNSSIPASRVKIDELSDLRTYGISGFAKKRCVHRPC